MDIKTDLTDELLNTNSAEIVSWEAKYATGIKLIDDQHKELVFLTNQLYKACNTGQEVIDTVFKDALHQMVEYVRFHFSTEQELLEHIEYPSWKDHAMEHDKLVRDIVEATKDYEAGRKYTPYNFARVLRNWVFGHIAHFDKLYSLYVVEEKKKGLLQNL